MPLTGLLVTHKSMAWKSYTKDDYDSQLYKLIHCGLDRLIDLGSRMEAHEDVLATHEEDLETGEVTKLPDVHPEQLLMAQLGLDGAEDEAEITQKMIQLVSRIMIIRNARNIVKDSPTPETD
jgi:hypothetical protein